MTPDRAIKVGACTLITVGVLFYIMIFVMRMMGMRIEYTGAIYAGIGFWMGSAFTLSIMHRVLEVSNDKSVAE